MILIFPKIRFRVLCSKGTYIRSLAHDFGQALGSGAHLTALRREAIGDFSVKKAFTVETFEDLLRESFEQKRKNPNKARTTFFSLYWLYL